MNCYREMLILLDVPQCTLLDSAMSLSHAEDAKRTQKMRWDLFWHLAIESYKVEKYTIKQNSRVRVSRFF